MCVRCKGNPINRYSTNWDIIISKNFNQSVTDGWPEKSTVMSPPLSRVDNYQSSNLNIGVQIIYSDKNIPISYYDTITRPVLYSFYLKRNTYIATEI